MVMGAKGLVPNLLLTGDSAGVSGRTFAPALMIDEGL